MKNNPKIAVLVDQLIPGGVQKTAIQEVKYLRKMNYDARLLILMRKGFEKQHSKLIRDIPHEFLSDRYPKIFQKSYKLPFFKFLSTLHLVSPILSPITIKNREFDVIISHGTTTSLTTWTLSRFRNLQFVAIIHDPMIYILDKIYKKTPLYLFFPILKPVSSFLEKHFIKAAKVCLVDSNVHANFIKKSYGVSPRILHLAVEPHYNNPKLRGDALISFGRWDRGKNLDILLQLLKKIPGAKLIIAGSWSSSKDLDWFQNLIEKNALKKRVQLIPKYDEKDLAEICKKGRVWIHPHFEAFSLSALEAASFGLPIIIPKKSGITELFRDKEHGFFPSTASVEQLLKPTKLLLENLDLASLMGAKAAKLVARKYIPKIRAKKLSDIIREITLQKISLIALETGHVGTEGVAGGDLLLSEMVRRLKIPLSISVVIPTRNTDHWQKPRLKVNLKYITPTLFDKYTGPWGVFTTYILRIIRSLKIISGENLSQNTIIYSSTSILPDVIPAFIIKITKPKTFWLARIHHLLPQPQNRPGRYWVNLGSYILQWISLKTILKKANLTLALNENLRNQLIKMGFPEKKIVTIGGGVDFEAIEKFKSKGFIRFDAVFLGRIHHAKGVFDLPIIWKTVCRTYPNAKLAIIGPGDEYTLELLKIQIKKQNLQDQITILGFLPKTQIYSHLKGAKAFLFSDHEAGFGLAAAEAMAAGCPLVGWDIGVLGSVFKKGFIKTPLGDNLAYARNVLMLLDNPNLQKKLSREALAESKKHSWEKIATNFEKIIANVANQT